MTVTGQVKLSLGRGKNPPLPKCFTCGKEMGLSQCWVVFGPWNIGSPFWLYCSIDCLDEEDIS